MSKSTGVTEFAVKAERPAGMSSLAYRIRSRRKLPEPNLNYRKGAAVSDGDLYPGEKYMTSEGQSCIVLTHEMVFMGYSSVVGFPNGAVRRLQPHDTLYEAVPV